MVKSTKLGKVMIAGLAAQLLLAASPVKASTLDQLNAEEQEQQQVIANLEGTIAEKLQYINEKKAEVENLHAEIAAVNTEKEQTTKDIEKQKELIEERKTQLEERLVALQVSPSTTSRIMMLFESENFGDFVGRFIALAQLQAADKDRVTSAIEEEEKLQQLEQQLAEQIETVKEKTALAETESEAMNAELENLQALLAENQESLMQIVTKKENEKARLEEVARAEKAAAEKAAAEKAAAEQAAAETAETTAAAEEKATEAVSATQTSTPAAQAPQESPAAPSQGRTLSVSATAYSRNEPGMGNFTFTGIDLRQNSMVIAVDPSVIPLGSLVDVPGYGIAIAGDTGGAIIGNKIDLHMEDLNRVHAFGRQQMTVTILN